LGKTSGKGQREKKKKDRTWQIKGHGFWGRDEKGTEIIPIIGLCCRGQRKPPPRKSTSRETKLVAPKTYSGGPITK